MVGYNSSKANGGIALAKLARMPKIKQKFENEALELIRQPSEVQRDYDSSPYIDMFVKESLRLYTPVSTSFPRLCVKNCQIGGVKIYKGSILTMNYARYQKDASVFDEPYKFDPSRFEDKKAAEGFARSLSNIPFSAGRRNCIAQYLGEVMIKILLVVFLGLFEVDEDPESGFEMTNLLVLEMKKIGLRLKPRLHQG